MAGLVGIGTERVEPGPVVMMSERIWESSTMQVQKAIQERLSIRQYAAAPIPAEHMEILFRALQLAPSANNSQNWEFVFVSDPEIKRRLVRACLGQGFIKDCAYFIAGLADPRQKWHMVDVTISLTQFTLQAVELGYGTCWIGAFDETHVKEVLQVPQDRKVVVCMTLGRPRGRHIPRERKAIEDFVYRNQFGTRFELSGE